MRMWTWMVGSWADLLRILAALGAPGVVPADNLRLATGLALLERLGIRSSWTDARAMVARLVELTSALIGRARSAARVLGLPFDNINKIFRGCHLPSFGLSCRWAAILASIAASRGLRSDGIALCIELADGEAAAAGLQRLPTPFAAPAEKDSDHAAPDLDVGEAPECAQPPEQNVVAETHPAPTTTMSVVDAVVAMTTHEPPLAEDVAESVVADEKTAQEAAKDVVADVVAPKKAAPRGAAKRATGRRHVGEMNEAAPLSHPPRKRMKSRLTSGRRVPHLGGVHVCVSWRFPNGSEQKMNLEPHKVRETIDHLRSLWPNAAVFLNDQPVEQESKGFEAALRDMEARIEARLVALSKPEPAPAPAPAPVQISMDPKFRDGLINFFREFSGWFYPPTEERES
jgi:hypothetical protein